MTEIAANDIVKFLLSKNVTLATGVPDSVLSPISNCFDHHLAPSRGHIIATNEGNAAAIAMGCFMATGQPAVVYLQNSGIGNLVNPIMSLAHKEVYNVPMFLLIGWRGMPGIADEPQHVKQGQATQELLDCLDIPHWTLDSDKNKLDHTLSAAWNEMVACQTPVALLVKPGSLAKWKTEDDTNQTAALSREEALRHILELSSEDDIFVATTGKTGRELYELRMSRGEFNDDFLTVGGMGHASSIAYGIAKFRTERRVVCLDGDGAVLMHMGALATIGAEQPKNLVYVLLNNASHDSVGGQPTHAGTIDFCAIATAFGFKNYKKIATELDLKNNWPTSYSKFDGPLFLELKIRKGARKDLGRPNEKPKQNRFAFMKKLGSLT